MIAAISFTALSNAALFCADGFCIPLTLRTNWSADASISACVAGGAKLKRSLMFRHMEGR